MVNRTQMRLMMLGLCGLTLGAACASRPAPFARDEQKPRSDRPAPFNPAKTYPEWAYDAPSYTKPVADPKSEVSSRAKDPAHFFTSKPVIMVHQPEGYVAEEIPRVAIWYSRDNGNHWEKAGYFGRSETYYKLQVKKEGDYGIRFVGPGQEAAMEALPYPVCVHHVDMTPPKVALSIDPAQAWYNIGQRVTVNWKATDPHLEAIPARVSVITDWESDQVRPIEVAKDQADSGAIEYTIPGNLMGDGFRFRVDAIDRAGNIGLAYSQTLQIVADRMGDGEKPPVQMSRYNDPTPTATPTTPATTISPTPVATPAPTPTPSSTVILPLEEIPAQGSTQGIDIHAPAERAATPSTPITGDQSQATPVTPSNNSASRTTPPSIEPLPLMPIEPSTPVNNSTIKTPATPIPSETKEVETHSHVNGAIIRDTPVSQEVPTDAASEAIEAESTDEPITPVSVSGMTEGGQLQASQDNDVECDDENDADQPSDDGEASESMPSGAESDDEAVDADASASRFKGRLVNELRAAEAAVERLLASVKGTNGVSASELVRGADVLVGGGLAAPMPATVISMTEAPPVGPRHAWRALMAKSTRRGRDVWTLPRPVLNFELPRLFAREATGSTRERDLSHNGKSATGNTPVQSVAVSSDPD